MSKENATHYVGLEIPAAWMTLFGKLAGRLKMTTEAFLLQVLHGSFEVFSKKLGDIDPHAPAPAPLSEAEKLGGYREVGIRVQLVDLQPLERVAAVRGVDPAVLVGEAIEIACKEHRKFLKENPQYDEAKH